MSGVRVLFLALLAALALAGCTTQPSQISSADLVAAPAGNGLLVGSYARPGPKERFSTESVYFRKIGTRKTREIGINTLPLVPLTFDFQEDGSCGSLFVFSLPPGRYEIYDFAVIQEVFGGSITHAPSRRFSIRFDVVEGKVCYLGELKIDRIPTAKFLGLPGSDNVRYELSDQMERDLPIFRRKYPDVSLPVENVKPSADQSIPFIRIE